MIVVKTKVFKCKNGVTKENRVRNECIRGA